MRLHLYLCVTFEGQASQGSYIKCTDKEINAYSEGFYEWTQFIGHGNLRVNTSMWRTQKTPGEWVSPVGGWLNIGGNKWQVICSEVGSDPCKRFIVSSIPGAAFPEGGYHRSIITMDLKASDLPATLGQPHHSKFNSNWFSLANSSAGQFPAL